MNHSTKCFINRVLHPASALAGVVPVDLVPSLRRILLVGLGSLGRPLAVRLAQLNPAQLNLEQLTLVDPKRYQPLSVATQCDPVDVHRLKVDVVAALTMRAGVPTTALAQDICSVPDGFVGADTVVISCVDNTRALIRANRMAGGMGARLLKLNIEPLVNCISLRGYDLANSAGPCAECQLSDRHYAQQHHPRSCDAPVAPRRTAGSRELAEAAAEHAFSAVKAILAQGAAAAEWFGWESQWNYATGQLVRSRLDRYDQCRRDHASRWSNLFRLAESPDKVTLLQLVLRRHHARASVVELCFDQQVSLQSCCEHCQRRSSDTRWVTGVDMAVGQCRVCGSRLWPVPFYMRQQLSLAELWQVSDSPLSSWGVVPGAVIQVAPVATVGRLSSATAIADSSGRRTPRSDCHDADVGFEEAISAGRPAALRAEESGAGRDRSEGLRAGDPGDRAVQLHDAGQKPGRRDHVSRPGRGRHSLSRSVPVGSTPPAGDRHDPVPVGHLSPELQSHRVFVPGPSHAGTIDGPDCAPGVGRCDVQHAHAQHASG